jgi:UDP-glucose:(heptosyl)LPS alpha-1,3-glucosyltransferase
MLSAHEKRVAVFLPRLSKGGGVEGQAMRIAGALAQAGYAVDFVCARVESEPPPGVHVLKLGRFGGLRVLKMLWFAAAAQWLRQKKHYDLCISPAKLLEADLVRVSGGPVSVFHRLSRRGYPPGLPRMLKDVRRAVDPSHLLTRFLDARQIRSARCITAVSHKTVEWMAEAYPWLDASQVHVIYNKPDLQHFSPCSADEKRSLREGFAMTENETALGFAGTAFARKGLATLIAAMAFLPQHYVLYVAGGRGRKIYEEQARKLGVAQRVRFLGHVQAMADFYRSVDVFALPSHYDTCSNALLEAMACGTPCIGSADDGSSWFLPPEFVLKDTENAEELAGLIKKAAACEPAPFTWPEDIPAGVEAYVDLVDKLLGVTRDKLLGVTR